MFFISDLYNKTESKHCPENLQVSLGQGGAGDTSKDNVFIHTDVEKLEDWTSMYMNLYSRIHCCT